MAESYYQHAEHYYRIINAQEYGGEDGRRPRGDFQDRQNGQGGFNGDGPQPDFDGEGEQADGEGSDQPRVDHRSAEQRNSDNRNADNRNGEGREH